MSIFQFHIQTKLIKIKSLIIDNIYSTHSFLIDHIVSSTYFFKELKQIVKVRSTVHFNSMMKKSARTKASGDLIATFFI